MYPTEFLPKIVTVFKNGISKKQIEKEIFSGIIVGVVALPLAIAFAIASGVTPDKGLVTAVVAGFLISLLGGSRVQIGGPTGAFIVIVYAIVEQHGVVGLAIATFMAGFIIILMGLLRLGNYLKFIPYPLIVGFTSGIAVVIFTSQINDFLGLGISNLPSDFIEKWKAYFSHFTSVNFMALGIAMGTIFIGLYMHKLTSKIPGSIVAIILSTLVVFYFDLPVETIESRFGEIPSKLTIPEWPSLNFKTIQALIQPAIAIALLGSIESLLSAVVADGMTGGKHRPNAELIAQGTANIFSGMFGGIPATGAIARTVTNIKNGGRTPIAGMVHAMVLLLIMLFFAPYAKLIPLSCLAGVLILVAWHMAEWENFSCILKGNRLDAIILLSTFLLTVLFDLILAIEVGLILSSFMFMKRMGEAMTITNKGVVLEGNHPDTEQLFEDEKLEIPTGVELYEINGPLFFGASQKFQETLQDLHQKPKILIIRLRYVPFIDATGLYRLTELIKNLKKGGTDVLLSGVAENVRQEILKSANLNIIKPHDIFNTIQDAINAAREKL